MENAKIANQALVRVVDMAIENKFSQEDWAKIKECLKNADLNHKLTQDKITVLMLTAERANKELFLSLLEQKADISATDKLGRTVLHRLIKLHASPSFDIEICENLLKHKADPNIIVENWGFQQTPLAFAAYSGRSDLVKLLITYKADVNQKDTRLSTPLGWAIYKAKTGDNTKTIKKLCKAGVSLLGVNSQNDTAFHLLVGREAELIRIVMTYARFEDNFYNIYNQIQDKQIKEKIIEILLVLKKLRICIPEDIRLRIIAKLPINYFYHAESGLCRFFLQKGYQHPYISAQVNKRVECLRNTLITSNGKGTALQKLHKEYPYIISYKQKVEPLFNGSKLQKDMEKILNNEKLAQHNLVYNMYFNCSKLLQKNKL